VIDRFCIARPSFRVAESGSLREHALPDRYHTGGGLGREEIMALLQPQLASAMRWVGGFRAGFVTSRSGSARAPVR
jgi:hypothetical protein